MNKIGTLALTVAAGLLSQSNSLPADSLQSADGQGVPKRQWAASLRWENDCFGGTDRFYPDGVALGKSHTGPSWMDPVANWLRGRSTPDGWVEGFPRTVSWLSPARGPRVGAPISCRIVER